MPSGRRLRIKQEALFAERTELLCTAEPLSPDIATPGRSIATFVPGQAQPAPRRSAERRLGTRLLHRMTRRVAPTESASAFYDETTTILHALDEAERALSARSGQPTGLVRFTALSPSTSGTSLRSCRS